jgi:predicted N-acyltransferase
MDENYYLDLTGITSVNDYFSRLKKKKRHNLKRDRKRILELKPRIVYNDASHLERMYELSIERFAHHKTSHEKSTYEYESDRQLFRVLSKHVKQASVRIISTVINNEVEAVEVGFIHNNVWYAVTAGTNFMKYSGLGMYSNILVIEEAIKSGCTKIDFLQEDYNWKKSWQLSSTQFYQFGK